MKTKISRLLHIFKVHEKECFLIHFKATVGPPKTWQMTKQKTTEQFLPSAQDALALNQHFLTQITTTQTGKHFFFFLLKEQISNQNDKILIINSIRKILYASNIHWVNMKYKHG